jgi:A/G-specific adenine glycosylase
VTAGSAARQAVAGPLLAWHERHGRHDLPWQREPYPYRVWVSEIMLQQTQVATVIPYFERFMSRFPTIAALADADIDDVLHLWSGLGYYARARYLHRAARCVMHDHAGRFPETLETVMALPGIGRSTAGAILALAYGQRHPILDGNVKRVLCRYYGIDGWPGRSAVERRLWALAEAQTPRRDIARYTQAIMDLGATVCRRGAPVCAGCPLADGCRARAEGRQSELPAPRPKRTRPTRETAMLILLDAERRVLLRRRAPTGIWGGLWSLPEIGCDEDAVAWCRQVLGGRARRRGGLPRVRHGFTHFDLEIQPQLLELETAPGRVMDGDDWLWYNPRSPNEIGLPAVVARLLDRDADHFELQQAGGSQ